MRRFPKIDWRWPKWNRIQWLFATLAILVCGNWVVQSFRKPSEVIGVADSFFYKSEMETWQAYGKLFKRHSTPICTPVFLAALAQNETGGNPIARTYWTFRWTLNPLRIYAPASSSVGLLQMTDGTFEIARNLCIHDGKVVRSGAWNDFDSCWFTFAYNRLVPGDAIEITAAYLQLKTAEIVSERPKKKYSLDQQQKLAVVTHLCGAGRARQFFLRGFLAGKNEFCGSHRLASYLAQFQNLKVRFQRLHSNSSQP